ncbi:MAG: PepSY domain-containing protein [Proteobacteria bacterium]|nr:PepSY domain-containing protein [Pseudomonadota bacterium]
MFKLRSLLSLHRRMGITSALFVILLSVSGLALHHGESLDLDSRFIDSAGMLRWYGIEAPGITLSHSIANHRATLIADAMYFDDHRLPGSYNGLTGMVVADSEFAIATHNQVLLILENGELVEVLSGVHGTPRGIEAIGTTASGQIYLNSDAGLFEVDIESLSWTESTLQQALIDWSIPSAPRAETADQIQSDYAASLISWERLMLDIHSGRLLGDFGVLLVDIMTILFVLMAATGVWIWSRRRS